MKNELRSYDHKTRSYSLSLLNHTPCPEQRDNPSVKENPSAGARTVRLHRRREKQELIHAMHLKFACIYKTFMQDLVSSVRAD